MSKKGFTLIELLIVISIIGLLASIVLVGFGSFRARGRDARRIADLRETQNALELFYTKNNAYPGSLDWATLISDLTGAGIGVNAIPNDPLNSPTNPIVYLYSPSTDFQNYAIGAVLEDPNHPVLQTDVDSPLNFTDVNGIDCGDLTAPVYCVAF
ncbi:MAG: prepilin-type N-terminal cleavage/methylation domain-containing protein [Candidatus Brennerbacteria bacterium]|nr:prepilin-type N-terminal cleavage/methylation domain-containing protein [Candidatus Brennerbacteria bacterium]